MSKNISVRSLSCFIFFFIFISTYAQKNFIPGSVFFHNRDTINGWIDYRNWKTNPDKVFFKEERNRQQTAYGPMDIAGFKVSDELYKSAIVQVEVSTPEVREMEYRPDLIFEMDTAFLQTMIEGKKSLYLNEYKYGRDQFYIKTDSGYTLLVYKQYLKKSDVGRELVENNKYIGQLAYYLRKNPEIHSVLKNAKYTKKGLEKIFRFYYEGLGQKPAFARTVDKAVLEVGAIGGLSSTSLQFAEKEDTYSGPYKYLFNGDFTSSENFTVGVFLNLVIPRHNGRWAINNELIYTSFEIHGNYGEYEFNELHNYPFMFKYSYLKANNMLRFKYPIGKLFWFINGGVTNGYIIGGENYYRKHGKPALENIRKHEFGFLGGTGISFKRLSLEFRGELTNGISRYVWMDQNTRRYFLLLGYRF